MAIDAHSQSLKSDTSFGTPHAVDTVTAQHSNRIPALRRRCCQAEFSLVPLRNAIRKAIAVAGFDFASILQYHSVGAVFVERRAPFDSLQSDDACMVCEECVDPPTEKDT
jgi:hypothetical protein